MRVLLTGVTGFIGHHILEYFMRNTDWEVVGLYRSFYTGRMNRIDEVMKNNEEWWSRLTMIHHDLRDVIHIDISRLIGDVNVIYHVGASSHVDRSITNPKEFLRDNVDSTINLIDFAIERKGYLDKFIYYSTDEVYGTAPDGVFHNENSPHRPGNPYAASKAAAEDYCWAYMNTYGVPIIITNTMNIIGERQHPEKFVPKAIKACISGEKLLIHTHPDGIRAGKRYYLYAENSAATLHFLTKNGVLGEKYNISGEKGVDNMTMANTVYEYVKEWNTSHSIDTPDKNFVPTAFDKNRPGHDIQYGVDSSKILNMGYRHLISFEEGLAKTIKWTMENKHWLYV